MQNPPTFASGDKVQNSSFPTHRAHRAISCVLTLAGAPRRIFFFRDVVLYLPETIKFFTPKLPSATYQKLVSAMSSDTQLSNNNPSESLIEDPLPTMFSQYQQWFINKGCKRISYPREYKLAAIQRVRSGKSRYRVAKELNITESMIGKWIIALSEILAMKKRGRRAVSG